MGKGVFYFLKVEFLALNGEFGIKDFGLCGQIIWIWTIDGLQCKCELKSRAPNEEAQTSPFVLSEPFDLSVGGATG